MHILRQIFLFKILLVIAVIFLVIFTIAFIIGINTVIENDRTSRKTNYVLSELATSQQLSESAVNEGRIALFSVGYNKLQLESKRNDAIYSIDNLLEYIKDDELQINNVQEFKNTLLYRFELQDEQLKESKKVNGDLIIDQNLVQQLSKATFDTETAIAKIRLHQLNVIFNKDITRINLQWKIIYVMIASITLGTFTIIGLILFLLRELNQRRIIAEKLREGSHITVDGEVSFGKKELDEIFLIIEQGETAIQQLKST